MAKNSEMTRFCDMAHICDMAHFEGKSSNELFEALEDWEQQLKHHDLSDWEPKL